MASKLTYDTGTGVCTGYVKRGASRGEDPAAGHLTNPDASLITNAAGDLDVRLDYYHVTGALGDPDTRAIALRSQGDRDAVDDADQAAADQAKLDAIPLTMAFKSRDGTVFDMEVGNDGVPTFTERGP